MKKRLYVLLLPVITLILEMLPFGVKMKFAPSETERIIKEFAYFDPISFGYGNPWPFFTSILTVVILALLIIYVIKSNKNIFIASKIITAATILISLGALLVAIPEFTALAVIIPITLLLELIILFIPFNKVSNKN